MSSVVTLQPGDLVTSGPGSAVYIITRTEHPLYPGLYLVIWRLLPSGRLSLDALSPDQEVGEVAPATDTDRRAQLRGALLGKQHEHG